jgi:hypothetical protein
VLLLNSDFGLAVKANLAIISALIGRSISLNEPPPPLN